MGAQWEGLALTTTTPPSESESDTTEYDPPSIKVMMMSVELISTAWLSRKGSARPRRLKRAQGAPLLCGLG